MKVAKPVSRFIASLPSALFKMNMKLAEFMKKKTVENLA
jgi:hypothetical protein